MYQLFLSKALKRICLSTEYWELLLHYEMNSLFSPFQSPENMWQIVQKKENEKISKMFHLTITGMKQHKIKMNCNMIISPWKSYRSIPGSRLWDHTMLPMERILTLNKWSYIFKLHHFCGFSPVRFPLWWALILSSIHYLVNSNNLDNHSQITLSSLNSITSYDLKWIWRKFF